MTDLSRIGLDSTFDLDALRARLSAMTEEQLLDFGKRMHNLV